MEATLETRQDVRCGELGFILDDESIGHAAISCPIGIFRPAPADRLIISSTMFRGIRQPS